MTQAFKLSRIEGREIVPDTGESLGAALATAAGNQPMSSSAKAQLYYLAAEAFEHGASVSMGHNRSDRYEQRARELRGLGKMVEDAQRAEREEAADRRMTDAFTAGYKGEAAGTRFSFESREAFQLGQMFANDGDPMPKRIHLEHGERGAHWFDIDGEKFTVTYPTGKVNEQVIERVR